MKPRKMIPKKMTMTRAENPKVFHRDFLGAHRYTTGGGTARPAGGSPLRFGRCKADVPRTSCTLRTAVVCRGQPRGDTTFSPLRSGRRKTEVLRTSCAFRCFHTYPYVYFALGKALKSRASPGTKSVLSVRPCFGIPSRWKARCGHDS